MNRSFCTIHEGNKLSLNKAADQDVVYYSELNEWFTSNAFRSFSLKYVIDRCIHYKTGNREHTVNAGNFLLACRQPDVKAYFDSKTTVKSICIDICSATVADSFTVMSAKGDWNFDNYLSGYFQQPVFFETVSPVNSALPFHDKLTGLVQSINKGEAANHINKEWFLDLVEKVVYHEYGNYLALNGIQSVKWETRKEILHRLRIAKGYMDDSFLSIEDINEVAVHCNLSEFHFFRSFRQAYGITPYQYILNKRIALADELIREGVMNITAISSHCNFPDLFTFSKAYKRRFGIAPSQVRLHSL